MKVSRKNTVEKIILKALKKLVKKNNDLMAECGIDDRMNLEDLDFVIDKSNPDYVEFRYDSTVYDYFAYCSDYVYKFGTPIDGKLEEKGFEWDYYMASIIHIAEAN